MSKEQLQQKIVDMEKQLAELKKELEKKDKGIWKPELDENYYSIDNSGDIDCQANIQTAIDVEIFNFGNYYKTREEALKQANYLKYTNLLRKYVEEHSEPIDWRSIDTPKHYIWYDHEIKILKTGHDIWARLQGIIYASSEEVLKDAIEFVGEENLKKYVFQVEE